MAFRNLKLVPGVIIIQPIIFFVDVAEILEERKRIFEKHTPGRNFAFWFQILSKILKTKINDFSIRFDSLLTNNLEFLLFRVWGIIYLKLSYCSKSENTPI